MVRRVDLVSTDIPGVPTNHPMIRRDGKRIIMLLNPHDHCGNCPGYAVSWVVPDDLAQFARHFKPIIVASIDHTERIVKSNWGYPSICFIRGEGGARLREFCEAGYTPRAATKPEQTLWQVWIRPRGQRKKPWAFVACPAVPIEYKPGWWTIESWRIHPNTGELIKGGEFGISITGEEEFDETTSWISDLVTNGEARLVEHRVKNLNAG